MWAYIFIALIVILIICTIYYAHKHKSPRVGPVLPPTPANIGQSCANGQCVDGGACDIKDKMCYETCYDTATRKAADIPRIDKYHCDYGNEIPIKPAPA
jgi:hypothetical protein